ncbi:MAG: glutamine-hydrolyzing GMP synthase [Chitinophagales bacterium]|nr:glutamine-hydrolyzing GMP synthase [Chitinophagales bacterium]
MTEKLLILDFGSQYTQLIARRVRELNVYCEIIPFHKEIDWNDQTIKGVILSGSPFSSLDENCPQIDIEGITNHVPVLAVCYSAQYTIKNHGGTVSKSKVREYGRAKVIFDHSHTMFRNVEDHTEVWMSHSDSIVDVGANFHTITKTENGIVAAFASNKGLFINELIGVQFHPEVTHTQCGKEVIERFVKDACHCHAEWTTQSFIHTQEIELREKIGKDYVILGLSGGVDSSVAAYLLHRAIGKQLICIFIDNGLLRKNEFEDVLHSYKESGLNIIGVNASEKFYTAMKGLTEPEAKRKAIGRVFIEVFEEEAKKIDNAQYLAQGTIYPDVIESLSVNGPSATIKSHHNVGGLPEKLGLKIVEPLRLLFKDEVRRVGKDLGVPPHILNRHPFPGPGLGIRIIGEVNAKNVKLLQEADAILTRNLHESGWYEKIWQSGVILLPVHSVGVMGDERTYEQVVAIRCVHSLDGMTADWVHLPYEILAKISNEIINHVKGINRVVYDISSKPPATIEWE